MDKNNFSDINIYMDGKRENNGLKSMSLRIRKIEKYIDDDKEDVEDAQEDALTKMMHSLRQKEKDKKKESMKTILHHFEEDIQQIVIHLTFENVVVIIFFIVRYVESNAPKLSSYLQVKISGEFKKSLALSFAQHLLNDHYSQEMLEMSIDTIHSHIYPKPILTYSPKLEHPQMVEEKKGFFGRKKKS